MASERLLCAAIREFSLNPDKQALVDGVAILLRLVRNLLRKPQEAKYRQVRLENPVLNKRLLGLKGSRTALRGIGFTIDESGDFYAYSEAPLERCEAILDAFRAKLVEDESKNEVKSDAAAQSTGKEFVHRVGPSSNDGFQRFGKGISGLKQRWAELQFVLRKSLSSDEELKAAQVEVERGRQFLEDLESVSREANLLQGIVLQATCGDAQGNAGDTSALQGKVSPESVARIQEGCTAFRNVLRVKITDDADLDTARRAILDSCQFFSLLCEEAAARGTTSAFAVLRELI